MTRRPLGASGRIAKAFLESKLTPLLVVVLAPRRRLRRAGHAARGGAADQGPDDRRLRRDARRHRPGGRAPPDVAPVEKAIYEIPNVEYVYSTSQPSGGMIIVRFLVGTDPDQAVVRVHAKLGELAPSCRPARCRRSSRRAGSTTSRSSAYTLWSRDASPMQLRQVADELKAELTPPPARRAGDRPRRPAARRAGHLRPRPPRRHQRLARSRPTRRSPASTGGFRPGASPRPTPRRRSRSARSSATPTRSAGAVVAV